MNRFKPHIALLICNIVWAMDYPFYNIVLPRYVHPMAMVSGSLIATALFSLVPLLWQKAEKVEKADVRKLIGAALLIGVLRKVFIMYGLSMTSPIDGSIIDTIVPLLVLLLSVLLGMDRFTKLKIAGLVLGMAGAVAVVLAGKRRWKALAAQVIPYVMLGVGVLTFCTLNYTHYGVFALSDFSEGSFAAAMGAMMRVDTDSTAPYLSVPADAREKIYDAVPELEPLAYWLEEDAQLQNDFRDPNLDDYRAGSFYWAIRRAAQFEGIYADAKTADAYWQTVADKINAACDAGTLPSRTGRRVATSQPISAAYVPSTLAETWNGFWHVLGLRDCAPYETLRSIGTEDDFAAWSGYLHCSFNSAAEAGKDTPYYSLYQKTVFAVMQGWTRVCSILLTVGVLCAVLCQLAELLPQRRQKCTAQTVVPWLLLFGIFGIALLRCAMIAFVEVSSFGIGTSTMYLATVHPLLVLYAFAGLLLYGRPRKTDKRRENA